MGKKFGDMRFAWDLYRRLVQMFSKVVLDVPGEDVRRSHSRNSQRRRREDRRRSFRRGLGKSRHRIQEAGARSTWASRFPEDPWDQLRLGVEAVFHSWMGKRAVDYRNHYGYPHDWGTAVNIVTMVYGNFADGKSGTGVAFTRNPSTGEKKFYGEYLLNAQGEDVVSGARTPSPVAELAKQIPSACDDLMKVADILEAHYARNPGHRIHHRSGQAVHAPDPFRQAYRCRRREDRGGYGERRPDHQGRSGGPYCPRYDRPDCCTRVSTPKRSRRRTCWRTV